MVKEKVVIIGGGESGTGAAVLAVVKGYDVFLSDRALIRPEFKKLLKQYKVSYEEGTHTYAKLLDADFVIKSPGIPETAAIMIKIREIGIPVISEIEFAYRFTEAYIIAITGSNGKTTTTLLTHHILAKAGLDVGLAGNVGKSFALQVATDDHEYYVLEVSSFQLDDCFAFSPDIAVLLNITPDHLDRYSNRFDLYAKSKYKITQNLRSNQFFVYNRDDEEIKMLMKRNPLSATCIPFSLYPLTEKQCGYVLDDKMNIHIHNKTFTMIIEQLALQGKHNLYDSMAAAISSRLLDIKNSDLKESLIDFVNAEHRLEFVAQVHGIEFVNDSKATNINSTWYALESINKPLIWIAGGQDKGNDYNSLKELVREKVKAIICLGKDNKQIVKSFKDAVPQLYETQSIWDAVNAAYKLGQPGDVVLLSPSCASFDLFENYEDRGNQFKNAVRNL